jgi:hypothetical protein
MGVTAAMGEELARGASGAMFRDADSVFTDSPRCCPGREQHPQVDRRVAVWNRLIHGRKNFTPYLIAVPANRRTKVKVEITDC